jgi:putative MATE family efflux protein
MNMTEGSIPKKMLSFAWPLIISGWLQLLFNVADLLACGQFVGNDAVGAIGATGSLINLVIDLFIGAAVGVNVVVGDAYGALDKGKAERAIGSGMLLSFAFSVFLCPFGIVMSRTFLTWMQTKSVILDMADTYIKIYFGGIPFLLIYNFGAAALRGMGDTKRPFIYLTIGGVLNVGLNYLFVIPFKMGVAGLALATIISEGISALLVLIALFANKKGFARLTFHNLQFYQKETREILRIGLPAGLQGMTYDIANVLIQANINLVGTNAAANAGDGASGRINGFMYVAMDAFAQAGVAFISANRGARKGDRIKESAKWSLIYSCLCSAVMGLLEIALSHQLLGIILQDDEEAIRYGQLNFYICGGTYITMALVDVFSSNQRGLGYSTTPMIVSIFGICVTRLIYIFTILQFIQPADFYQRMALIYAVYPISWTITAIAQGIFYYRLDKKVIANLANIDNRPVEPLKKEDNPR